jgi:phage-related protein
MFLISKIFLFNIFVIYLANFANKSRHMLREIIVYGEDFWNFYNAQNQKVRKKINWTIGILGDLKIIPEKYFKHIAATDLYEIRVISSNNIFRIICFFDQGSLVILLNGFQKKSRKTPKKEIEKAKKLKERYYEDKK